MVRSNDANRRSSSRTKPTAAHGRSSVAADAGNHYLVRNKIAAAALRRRVPRNRNGGQLCGSWSGGQLCGSRSGGLLCGSRSGGLLCGSRSGVRPVLALTSVCPGVGLAGVYPGVAFTGIRAGPGVGLAGIRSGIAYRQKIETADKDGDLSNPGVAVPNLFHHVFFNKP